MRSTDSEWGSPHSLSVFFNDCFYKIEGVIMRVQKISFKSRKEYLHAMNSENLALKRYPKHTRCLLDRVIRTHERILYEELERYVFIKPSLIAYPKKAFTEG